MHVINSWHAHITRKPEKYTLMHSIQLKTTSNSGGVLCKAFTPIVGNPDGLKYNWELVRWGCLLFIPPQCCWAFHVQLICLSWVNLSKLSPQFYRFQNTMTLGIMHDCEVENIKCVIFTTVSVKLLVPKSVVTLSRSAQILGASKFNMTTASQVCFVHVHVFSPSI